MSPYACSLFPWHGICFWKLPVLSMVRLFNGSSNLDEHGGEWDVKISWVIFLLSMIFASICGLSMALFACGRNSGGGTSTVVYYGTDDRATCAKSGGGGWDNGGGDGGGCGGCGGGCG